MNLSELEAAFEMQDPSGTGAVSGSEFARIMRQLAPDLSRWELDRLCARFALGSTERNAPHPLLTRTMAQQGPLDDRLYCTYDQRDLFDYCTHKYVIETFWNLLISG